MKLLGVVIRYYSGSIRKVLSTFLGLLAIESGTAMSMMNAVKDLLLSVKLNPLNLIGVGVDNANVNTGTVGGLYELLKKEFSLHHLVMVRCVCHSLQLAVSSASKENLPRI